MKTLTPVGINKQLLRLRDSLAYATFLEGGVKKKVSIFKADVEGNKIKIYVYLDDSVIGEVEDISLVDRMGTLSQSRPGLLPSRAPRASIRCSPIPSLRWKTRMHP